VRVPLLVPDAHLDCLLHQARGDDDGGDLPRGGAGESGGGHLVFAGEKGYG
jgi:hypothetical protein